MLEVLTFVVVPLLITMAQWRKIQADIKRGLHKANAHVINGRPELTRCPTGFPKEEWGAKLVSDWCGAHVEGVLGEVAQRSPTLESSVQGSMKANDAARKAAQTETAQAAAAQAEAEAEADPADPAEADPADPAEADPADLAEVAPAQADLAEVDPADPAEVDPADPAEVDPADPAEAAQAQADSADADLGVADLEVADLGAADLGAADLGPADLGAAELGPADLGAADLGPADLEAADLEAADVEAADPGAAAVVDELEDLAMAHAALQQMNNAEAEDVGDSEGHGGAWTVALQQPPADDSEGEDAAASRDDSSEAATEVYLSQQASASIVCNTHKQVALTCAHMLTTQ